MCGIAGFSYANEATIAALRVLELRIQYRGKDSWGFTNGHRVVKKVGDIGTTNGFGVPKWVREGDGLLVHTRGASAGNVTTANSHPFLVKGPQKTVLGVHNGCLYDWKDRLVKKFGMPDYAVDSNALYHMIAYDLPLDEVQGWGALVWFEWMNDQPEEKTINFCRFNMDDLHVLRMPDQELIWASTTHAIDGALEYMGIPRKWCSEFRIDSMTRYQYRESEWVPTEGEGVEEGDGQWSSPLIVIGEMRFGPRSSSNDGREWVPNVSGMGGHWETRSTTTTRGRVVSFDGRGDGGGAVPFRGGYGSGYVANGGAKTEHDGKPNNSTTSSSGTGTGTTGSGNVANSPRYATTGSAAHNLLSGGTLSTDTKRPCLMCYTNEVDGKTIVCKECFDWVNEQFTQDAADSDRNLMLAHEVDWALADATEGAGLAQLAQIRWCRGAEDTLIKRNNARLKMGTEPVTETERTLMQEVLEGGE